MEINTNTGLIASAQYCASPNYDERPHQQTIDLLVIHGISLPPGQFGGTEVQEFFSNQLQVERHPYFNEIAHLKVSSHLFIRRDGVLWQFVPLTKRAWHAGQSSFEGRSQCNDFSIGIELEGTDTIPYTPAQYNQLAQVTLHIMQSYPKITQDRIVGHCDIAPQRKTDPGPSFDWGYYKGLIHNFSVNKQIG